MTGRSAGGRSRALTEGRDVPHTHVDAQPPEPERVTENALIHSPVRTHLRHQLRAHPHHVQHVPAPPRRGERDPRPRVPRVGGGKVLGDLLREVGAQGDGAADGAQPAEAVVAAEDEELRTGQGAGDRSVV